MPSITNVDVCIVGAGIVGLTLAYRLRKLGKRVVVLERGDRQPSQRSVGEELENLGTAYSGGIHGRAFGLGGTSGLWGGQLVSTTTAERGTRPWLDIGAWAIPDGDLVAAYSDACDWLGIPGELAMPQSGTSSPLGKIGSHFLVRSVFSLPFTKRNFASREQRKIESDDDLVVLLNARFIDIERDNSATPVKVNSVKVATSCGDTFTLSANTFVICAGAIESTRILLHITYDFPGSENVRTSLGKRFRDHLSMPVGRFVVSDRKAFLEHVSPRFEFSGITHPRFELSAEAQLQLKQPSAFLHVVAHSNGQTALDTVRRILGMVQNRSIRPRPLASEMSQLLLCSIDLLRIAMWRLIKRKIYYPVGHEFLLQVDMEQMPSEANRIALSSNLDADGVPKAIIEWAVGEKDVEHANVIAELFAQDWNSSHAARFAVVETSKIAMKSVRDNVDCAYDVYHPIGTTALGLNAKDSTVNEQMCVHGFANLYTVSTAVMPSSGCANPTFSAIALAIRLAKHLTEKSSAPS